MEYKDTGDIELADDIGQFAETYSSFAKIINKLQRQYLALKEVHLKQSEELQSVNEALQSLVTENRAVTEFLDSILNSLSSGVIAIDRSGRITHLNPTAARILGIRQDQWCNHNLDYGEVMRIVDNSECSALETVRHGRTFDNIEKKVETINGTSLTLSVSTSLLRNHDKEVFGAVELFHDMSKVRKMEEQLSRMKTLASLGEMAASIAHEVRNPLVGISGFASLLLRDLNKEDPRRKMAKRIVEGVNNINQTIQTLLEFARHEKINREPLDLTAYLKIILDNFIDEYNYEKPGKRVIYKFEENLRIRVELDRQLFRQAVFNLLKNGLEAGEGNNQVNVRCRELPLPEAHKEFGDRLELSGTETLAMIAIEDNGPGIPEDEIDRVFSPFYTTRENGIGLGLAIAWKIVKAHCGDICVKSTEGQGARFTILLPARPAE